MPKINAFLAKNNLDKYAILGTRFVGLNSFCGKM
jgi:hypothetical protein